MRTVLLVEDNEMNSDMLSRRLTRRGYNVVVAADGMEGLNAASEHHPDIVLMDVSLPVLDGLEATKQLKAGKDTENIPVIALTAHAMEGDEKRCRDAGADDYDTKPVEFERLVAKIEALLSRGSAPA